MTPEQQERVRLLCKTIAEEDDPIKVEGLAAELLRLLSVEDKTQAAGQKPQSS